MTYMKKARISDVRPEFVFLGLLAEGPVHGYELYRRFRETFGSLWHISESQMYATLKRLEERGWTEQGTQAENAGAPAGAEGAERASGTARRTISITGTGRAAFEDWLSAPSAASPRALRMEFLTRLHFASRAGDAAPLIAAQRAVLEAELRSVCPMDGKTPAGGDGAERIKVLAADFRIRQVRAALDWMDALIFS